MRLQIAIATMAFVAATARAMAEDPAAIEADLMGKWVAAYNANKAVDIGALFAGDGIFNPASGVSLKGPDTIAKYLGDRIPKWPQETITVKEAHQSGDVIWSNGEYTLAGAGDNAGKQIVGQYSNTLLHDAQGWHIVVVTASMAPMKQ